MARRFASLTNVVFTVIVMWMGTAAFAQRGQAPPAGPTPTGPTTTTTPTPTPTTPNTRTPQPTQQPQQPYDMGQRPIFLSGKVMLDDGTPPPEPVVIERVCGGNPRPEAWTDSKGHFSFQLGQNTAMMADASVGSIGGYGEPDFGGPGMQQQRGMNTGSSGGFGSSGAMAGRDLMNCELRASLPGYRSDMVNLAGHRAFDNPDVGTIVLHRLGNVEGNTISATSLNAPKDARKAYDKGKDALKKKKAADAEKEFAKAVELYPKYAAAWLELGQLQQEKKQFAEARKSLQKAVEADAKYVQPWVRLSLLAAQDANWEELAQLTAKVIRLDPVDYPHLYFLSSVANYNLKNFEAAEKSALEAQKLDTKHRNPKIEQVLGLIMIEKRDYPAAADRLRAYLQFAPSASDAAQVRSQLAELDKVNGGSARAKEGQEEQEKQQ